MRLRIECIMLFYILVYSCIYGSDLKLEARWMDQYMVVVRLWSGRRREEILECGLRIHRSNRAMWLELCSGYQDLTSTVSIENSSSCRIVADACEYLSELSVAIMRFTLFELSLSWANCENQPPRRIAGQQVSTYVENSFKEPLLASSSSNSLDYIVVLCQ